MGAVFFCCISSKSKHQISEEIPQGGHTHGKHLAEVEIPFQLAVEEIDRQCVQAQADERDGEILDVFHPNLRIFTLEGPESVEDVVGGGGNDETKNVAQVLVPAQAFLAEVSHAKIDQHAREAHHTEFQELQQEGAGQLYVQQQRFHHHCVRKKSISRRGRRSIPSGLGSRGCGWCGQASA